MENSTGYAIALQAWAFEKTKTLYPNHNLSIELVQAYVEFEPGYVCCTAEDSDPQCYCSFAEEASLLIHITVLIDEGNLREQLISITDYNFSGFLNELLETNAFPEDTVLNTSINSFAEQAS